MLLQVKPTPDTFVTDVQIWHWRTNLALHQFLKICAVQCEFLVMDFVAVYDANVIFSCTDKRLSLYLVVYWTCPEKVTPQVLQRLPGNCFVR